MRSLECYRALNLFYKTLELNFYMKMPVLLSFSTKIVVLKLLKAHTPE